MRIINSVYGDSTGGRWGATLKTAELLCAAGHEVILLIAPEDQANIPADFASKVRVITLKNHGHWDVTASLKARAIIKAEKIDLCICHSGRAIYMLKRAARKLCPVVAYNHSHNIKRTLLADAFICITPYMQKIIQTASKDDKPTAVISNAISIPDESLLQPASNDVFTIGAIARMARNKGLHNLLDALALLKKQSITVNARIAGDGEERLQLQEQCSALGLQDTVKFIGWISAGTKTDFYNSVDIMCFTSESDVQPLVILESFAYAKTLIGTDTEGPSSMYMHKETAYVVPPRDPAALADAIAALLSDFDLRQTLAKNGRAKAIREHSDESITQQLEAFLQSLLILK